MEGDEARRRDQSDARREARLPSRRLASTYDAHWRKRLDARGAVKLPRAAAKRRRGCVAGAAASMMTVGDEAAEHHAQATD